MSSGYNLLMPRGQRLHLFTSAAPQQYDCTTQYKWAEENDKADVRQPVHRTGFGWRRNKPHDSSEYQSTTAHE